MAVLWVCILTSECRLRGACPVSLDCGCSSSHNQVAESPAEPALSRRPAYPACPLWTPASCQPQTPNHRSNQKQCFWSSTDNKREIQEARILTREGTRWRSGATLEQSPLCPQGRSFFLHASAVLQASSFWRGEQLTGWV